MEWSALLLRRLDSILMGVSKNFDIPVRFWPNVLFGSCSLNLAQNSCDVYFELGGQVSVLNSHCSHWQQRFSSPNGTFPHRRPKRVRILLFQASQATEITLFFVINNFG